MPETSSAESIAPTMLLESLVLPLIRNFSDPPPDPQPPSPSKRVLRSSRKPENLIPPRLPKRKRKKEVLVNNLPSFTFDDLIAILDPENECAHSWKKKIDLGAGTITFYELDLQSVVPRLSQYVRIQRQIKERPKSRPSKVRKFPYVLQPTIFRNESKEPESTFITLLGHPDVRSLGDYIKVLKYAGVLPGNYRYRVDDLHEMEFETTVFAMEAKTFRPRVENRMNEKTLVSEDRKARTIQIWKREDRSLNEPMVSSQEPETFRRVEDEKRTEDQGTLESTELVDAPVIEIGSCADVKPDLGAILAAWNTIGNIRLVRV